MKRTMVRRELLPTWLEPALAGATMFDSSSSPEAEVTFIDAGDGFFLKRAALGALERQTRLTRYFHGLGLCDDVLRYERDETQSCDWLLTARARGEDCVSPAHLAEPARLVDALAEIVRRLHDMPSDDCPEPDHTSRYLAAAEEGWRQGNADLTYYTDFFDPASADELHRLVGKRGSELRRDTLLHGDCCLPNIMLDGWRFSGFLDLDHAGVGDRHVDVYWMLWSLRHNLGSDRWGERFLDAYGRDLIDPERLRLVAAIEVFG